MFLYAQCVLFDGLFGCLRAHICYKHPSHVIASIIFVCVCGCWCCSNFGLSIVSIRINAQYRFDPYYKADALLKMPTCEITSFLKRRIYMTKSIQIHTYTHTHTMSVMEKGTQIKIHTCYRKIKLDALSAAHSACSLLLLISTACFRLIILLCIQLHSLALSLSLPLCRVLHLSIVTRKECVEMSI